MPDISIVTEADLRQCISLDKPVVDIIDKAFARAASGDVVMPPILSMAIEPWHGEIDVKTAYVPGLENFAVKISPGFFDNPKLGLPSLNGLVIVFDARTGLVRSVLLDNGLLTDIRTAAAGAVAARHLAPGNTSTVGVIGAGAQAGLQVRAIALERSFNRLLVWARDKAKVEQFAEHIREDIGCQVQIAPTIEECVAGSQLVVTTTPSSEPLIRVQWLHECLHITAMGSDAPGKTELDPRIVLEADRFIVDNLAQSRIQGELRPAIGARLIDKTREFDQLGEVCAGTRPGRESEDQITVCDLTGTGLQDTAIADYAARFIAKKNLGTTITN